MTDQRQPTPGTDSVAALLGLCRDIFACQDDLSVGAAQVRPYLSSGADAHRVTPMLQQQAEGAVRLKTLVETLGRRLGEARTDARQRDEVREAVEAMKVRLADLVGEADANYSLISRRGVRVPGVGGRPYPRRPLKT